MISTFIRKQRNVLGMNARILRYISPLNPARAVKTANDKLTTKQKLAHSGINTPRTYGVIRSRRDVENFPWERLPSSFVLKPNFGLGGSGILVAFGRNKRGQWIKANRKPLDVSEIRERVFNILDGNFSIGNIPDIALFEQRVRVTRELKPFSLGGVPDIRVLVANFVPVMAMLRLPTPESQGRANLHAGGIGVGIDLESGKTTIAIHRDYPITMYPNTRLRLSGITIENFHDILLVAAKAVSVLKLGYAGVDIAIDREEGPLVLEANARPGLSIQLANRTTLRDRLRRLEDLSVSDPEHAVDIALSLFAKPYNSKKKRKVIGVREHVVIFDVKGESHHLAARIDTGAYRSSIDRSIAKELGLLKHAHPATAITKSALGREERQVIPLEFILAGERISTEVTLAARGHLKHEFLIGRRDLAPFFVDPAKKLPRRQET